MTVIMEQTQIIRTRYRVRISPAIVEALNEQISRELIDNSTFTPLTLDNVKAIARQIWPDDIESPDEVASYSRGNEIIYIRYHGRTTLAEYVEGFFTFIAACTCEGDRVGYESFWNNSHLIY